MPDGKERKYTSHGSAFSGNTNEGWYKYILGKPRVDKNDSHKDILTSVI